MQYFNTLPLITQTDLNGNYITVSNLLTRAYLLPSLQKNIMLFYQYNIQEGDTPENMSYRYYNDMYRYWLILYANNIIDPQAEWPLTNQQFEIYINDKYAADAANASSPVLAYTLSTIHHYEQIITTSDTSNLQEQVITAQIDQDTYNSLMPSTTSMTFTNGTVVTKKIDKNAVSIYNFEVKENESKRVIQLIKDVYASDAEKQLQSLMR